MPDPVRSATARFRPRSGGHGRPAPPLLGILQLLLALAACASPGSGPQITIEAPWGRPSPAAATAGAFYMVIKNGGGQADRLVAAQSAACAVTELHESYQSADGVMGMRHLPNGIDMPPRSQVALAPGSFHVMCLDRQADFQVGSGVPLTLQFEKAGEKTVTVEIREP